MNCMTFRGVDYMLLDSQFSEQELLVRQTARRFVDEQVLPLIRDCYRDARFPSNYPGNRPTWDSSVRTLKDTAAPA